jgi:hypothetical protein
MRRARPTQGCGPRQPAENGFVVLVVVVAPIRVEVVVVAKSDVLDVVDDVDVVLVLLVVVVVTTQSTSLVDRKSVV